ncbi:MAG TPA: histidine phosphatase family protein [Gammaproteobacteria bacterium]|nr:histidine phosphatase family protein [Gammaproteobacteria bacterium]
MAETIIDLIRHGEPVGGQKYRGYSVDDPLSDKGWSQMWDAVGDCKAWKCIVSSPMLRCKAFAESLSEKLNIPYFIEQDLEEVGFGDWEGKTVEQVKQENQAEYFAFFLDPVNHRPKNAEDLDVFSDRVVTAYKKILEEFEGKHCLIVSHAGVIRAVLAHLLDAPVSSMYRIKVNNAGITRIRYDFKGPVLAFHQAPI